jgi:hypothetical protein
MSDRKYQQRGYMESDRDRGGDREKGGEERPRPPRPPRDPRDAPRGRGLGGPTASVFRCARCGLAQPVATAMAAAARCPGCGSDLHACTNCLSFDSSAPNQCRQPGVTRIARKDARNDCALFDPRLRQESTAETPAAEKAKPNDARAAFDALFKL